MRTMRMMLPSQKLLQRLARQKLKALRHARSDKILSRSRSQPSSIPGTPKNIMKSSDLRQCRTDTKNRRTSDLANAALEKSRERSFSLPNIEVGDHNSAPTTPASNEARSPTHLFSFTSFCISSWYFKKTKRGWNSRH
nr:uncharacterized protein LOC129284220 [Lytechinus pictus]